MTESSNVNTSLKNQIENMIDGIIGEEGSSLHFSEEEEETAQTDFSHIKIERVSKKYPTISFTNSTQCFQYNNQMFNNSIPMYSNYPTMFYMNNINQINRCEPHPNVVQSKTANNMNGNFGRKEKRNKTTTYLNNGVNMQVELLLYGINQDLIKNDKIDYYVYNRLKGNFVNVIKTHKGSKIFQTYLVKTPPDIIHAIYIEIKNNLYDIMCDFYGNYFCKKFFGMLNKKDRVDFILSIKGNFNKLSFDNVGTFPIQGIVEQVNTVYEKKLILSLIKNGLSLFCFNASGSHVIEKIISCFEVEYTKFIVEYAISSFMTLSTDQSGICVIKKIIETHNEKSFYYNSIKRNVIENIHILINHQFGYQIIQSAIASWNDISEIMSLIRNKMCSLSNGKYSSNVIEKCIERSEEILSEYIKELGENDIIGEVMKNSFGNYVIQKALKIAKGANEKELAESVNRNIYKLNDKKLILKWKNIVMSHMNDNV